MSTDDTKIILEHFDDKFSLLIENVETLIDIKLQPIKDDLKEVKDDIKIIKKAVKDTNTDLKFLDRRVTKLEHA